MRARLIALGLVAAGFVAVSARADDADEDPFTQLSELPPLPELATLPPLADLAPAAPLSELPPLPDLPPLRGGARVAALAPVPASPAASAPAPSGPAARPSNDPDFDADGDGDASMVSFPAGDVRLGQSDQFTRHMAAYSFDARAVTGAEYAKCVGAGKCTKPSCSSAPDARVTCVDLAQARAYCAFAGKRLPTEDEWERAGRARAADTDDGVAEWTSSPYCFFCDKDDEVVRGGPAHDPKLRGWRPPKTSDAELGFRCAK